MRLLFAGTPATAVPALDALLASRHDVHAVISRPDRPAGRGRPMSASAVAQHARAHGLTLLQPTRIGDPSFLGDLRGLAPDCVAIVAYGALIPPAALAIPPHGWVNLHFSLLPAWRGAAPVQHAILAGDDMAGATTFRLDEGLDTGPVVGSVTEEIRDDDTAGSLLGRLSVAGARLLVETIDRIEDGTAHPVPQPIDGASHAPKLTTDDARIQWTDPALAISRRVRACTPVPGAWTTFRGNRVKLASVRLDPSRTATPGEIRVERVDVRVGTGSHAIVLGRLQPAGRSEMAASDWARGVRLRPDDRFE